MNLVTYLSRSRGVRNGAVRLGRISQRFGVSPGPMRGALNELLAICDDAGCAPTLAVTAVLIDRYPAFFRKLATTRADLAVHGYVHTDHALLSEREQYDALEQALQAFGRLGMLPRGFRHPYLRYNDATWPAAAALGFTHASNSSIHFDVIDENIAPDGLAAYFKGLRLYGAGAHRRQMSLPSFVEGGIVDMPASLPDDEAVIDRMGLSGRHAGIYWLRTLQQTYDTGEMQTVVVHNERVMQCANSLRALLRAARFRTPAVWLATLSEVNDWWRKRSSWRLHIESDGDGRWRIDPPTDPEATVLVRGPDTEPPGKPWFGEWREMPHWPFLVRSEVAPLVSITDDADPALRSFLQSEGYCVAEPGQYFEGAYYVSHDGPFHPHHKRPLTETLEVSGHPFARIWRWPNGARSALSITSDVDAMTLLDFLRRPLEV